jgi:hypothetical protein
MERPKRRVLIVDFLNCTQVLSGKQYEKAGRIQVSEKRWYSALRLAIQIAEPIFVCEAALLPDFLCFILDATRIQVREIAIEMLFFLFILKNLSFAFVLCLLMS